MEQVWTTDYRADVGYRTGVDDRHVGQRLQNGFASNWNRRGLWIGTETTDEQIWTTGQNRCELQTGTDADYTLEQMWTSENHGLQNRCILQTFEQVRTRGLQT